MQGAARPSIGLSSSIKDAINEDRSQVSSSSDSESSEPEAVDLDPGEIGRSSTLRKRKMTTTQSVEEDGKFLYVTLSRPFGRCHE
jgi:hypothetical protein